MLSFRDYLTEALKPKYIAVQYDDETQAKLRKWAEDNGFDLTTKYDGTKQDANDFDFHTTIFFTTSTHDMENKLVNLSGSAKIVDFMLLGDNKDIPVLKVESDDISKLRDYFESTYDMKDAWPEYTPHVSISYAKNNQSGQFDLPTFELKFNQLKIADATR